MARPIGSSVSLYPRICGANEAFVCPGTSRCPLPPHMRGKLTKNVHALNLAPSTPAYAGQTMRNGFSIKRRLLYPRICGANAGVMADGGIDKPLPPHMRGKLTGGQSVFVRQASTPAYAGQTGRRHVLDLGHGLYPRICGANHRGRPGTGATLASTPAYAGQTSPPETPQCRRTLYPRICGANVVVGEQPGVGRPLPPHMRGKLPAVGRGQLQAASTPAYAGQTRLR